MAKFVRAVSLRSFVRSAVSLGTKDAAGNSFESSILIPVSAPERQLRTSSFPSLRRHQHSLAVAELENGAEEFGERVEKERRAREAVSLIEEGHVPSSDSISGASAKAKKKGDQLNILAVENEMRAGTFTSLSQEDRKKLKRSERIRLGRVFIESFKSRHNENLPSGRGLIRALGGTAWANILKDYEPQPLVLASPASDPGAQGSDASISVQEGMVMAEPEMSNANFSDDPFTGASASELAGDFVSERKSSATGEDWSYTGEIPDKESARWGRGKRTKERKGDDPEITALDYPPTLDPAGADEGLEYSETAMKGWATANVWSALHKDGDEMESRPRWSKNNKLHGVFVNFVPNGMTPVSLGQIFKDCGKVLLARVVNRQSIHRANYGFVYFESRMGAEKAINLNGRQLFGRELPKVAVQIKKEDLVREEAAEDSFATGGGLGQQAPIHFGVILVDVPPAVTRADVLEAMQSFGSIVKVNRNGQVTYVGFKRRADRDRALLAAKVSFQGTPGEASIHRCGNELLKVQYSRQFRLSSLPRQLSTEDVFRACSELGPVISVTRRSLAVMDVTFANDDASSASELLVRLENSNKPWKVTQIRWKGEKEPTLPDLEPSNRTWQIAQRYILDLDRSLEKLMADVKGLKVALRAARARQQE